MNDKPRLVLVTKDVELAAIEAGWQGELDSIADGVVGAYHEDCQPASAVDLQNWTAHDFARASNPTAGSPDA